jgi:hypothetical protein
MISRVPVIGSEELHELVVMEIPLLGLVEASHDGRAVLLAGVKPRALLAILALQANAPVSADRLIEGLWGGAVPPGSVGCRRRSRSVALHQAQQLAINEGYGARAKSSRKGKFGR